TLFAHLSGDQAGFGMVATDIEHANSLSLQLGDQGRIVLLSGSIGLVHCRLAAGRLIDRHGRIGETLAIGGLVVNEGNFLVGELFHKESTCNLALLVVTATNAENART